MSRFISCALSLAATVTLTSLILLASYGGARAALVLEAPAEVPQGAAFLVRARSDIPVKEITFEWRDRKLAVPALARPEGCFAEALLPMPLEGDAPLALSAVAASGTASTRVSPVPVAWSRQALQVDGKYVNPPDAVMERIRREQRETRTILDRTTPTRHWQAPLVRPVQGSISSEFGEQRVFNGEPRSRHRGVDLRGSTGTPVHALTGGVVALAGEQYYSGNVVYIDHGLGVVSLYAHLSAIAVQPGQHVEAGQIIGRIGATGRVTGPHLHLGVNILGFPVDPLSLESALKQEAASRQ